MGSLAFIPQGGSAPPKAVSDLLADLYPLLGASSALDLEFWTDTELVAWTNEGLKRLARRVALFIDRDTSITVVKGTAGYTLPARNLSTLHVSIGGARLRPVSVRELEGLSATWLSDSGTPVRYLQDHGAGVDQIRLYPEPDAGGTLAVVEHEYPADLTSGSDLPLPDPVSDYLLFFDLAEARRKESDAAIPEVSQWCEGILGLYEQAFGSYWGVSQ